MGQGRDRDGTGQGRDWDGGTGRDGELDNFNISKWFQDVLEIHFLQMKLLNLEFTHKAK